MDGKQAHHRHNTTAQDTPPSPHPRHTPKTEKDPFINTVLQPLEETRKVKNRKL